MRHNSMGRARVARVLAVRWGTLPLLLGCIAVLTSFLGGSVVQAATTQYFYDELGRIVQAVRSDGSVQQYQYDANGNVVAINRVSASSVSIANFSPLTGHVGASVTISGTGFSAVPGENTVTFSGGAQAIVGSASPTQIVVTVPAGAMTGPIAVAANGGSATSAMTYTVRRPAITGFTPIAVAPGASVTLIGNNLNLVPGSTTIRVGGQAATISTISNTQATFVPAAGSTHAAITADTPYGSASSSKDLVIYPGSGAQNVVAAESLPASGSGPVLNVTAPGKLGVYTFQATAGQYLTMQITALTTVPANSSLGYTLYSPSGTVIAVGDVGTLSALQRSLHLPPMPATGTYLLAFTSNASFQLTAALEQDAALSMNATLSASTAIAGQRKRFLFSATSGDSRALAITGISASESYADVSLNIYKPDGGFWNGGICYTLRVPGCSWNLRNLPATGTYTVIVTPIGQLTASFGLTVSSPVTGTLVPDVPQTIRTTAPGQFAQLTFTTTTTQTFALYVSGASTTPANQYVTVEVRNASNEEVQRFLLNNASTINIRDLPAGTYNVLVSVDKAATGSVQLHLASGLTGSLPLDGTTTTFANSVPGQAGYLTFYATAGSTVGLAMTNMAPALGPGGIGIGVYRPDGGLVTGGDCWSEWTPGCSWLLRKLPVTGTYTITVLPSLSQTASFALTVSPAVTGTLAPDTPQTVNLASRGQPAALTFTATAGQTFALYVNETTTQPTGRAASIEVHNSSGVEYARFYSATSTTTNLRDLPAGTYTVYVALASASTGTTQLHLASGLTGTLPIDGTSTAFTGSVPGQTGYFKFSATAGSSVALAITNMTMTPAGGAIGINVARPDGGSIGGWECPSWYTPGCSYNLSNLPVSGTYIVTVATPQWYTMAFTLTVSSPVTGAITLNIPQSVALASVGQYGVLTFTATADQSLSLVASSVSTTPANKVVYLSVLNASGAQIANGSSATGTTLNLPNLAAGTYKVLISPADAATATLELTLQ